MSNILFNTDALRLPADARPCVATRALARMKPVRVRLAAAEDVQTLCRCDTLSELHAYRKSQIERAVQRQECFVAEVEGVVAGFSVLHHEFFGRGFISLVVVASEFRRRGIALRLLAAAEVACRTSTLFTSTNASNGPAHALLRKAGFARSGVVDNLDPGDPEYIYFKEARKT